MHRDHDAAALTPFADMALAAIERAYPYHLIHRLDRDEDLRLPRELWPTFHGAFDWHSSVHGHWCLARVARLCPDAPIAPRAIAALTSSFEPARMAAEAAYLGAPGHEGFERPYGLAWLLQLGAELREWEEGARLGWSESLRPLESVAADRLRVWLPKLPWPDRSGQHGQTAFALGLALDWARSAGDQDLAGGIESRARHFYSTDQDAPIAYEPSGHDFLSPALAEADLMRRVLGDGEFPEWLEAFLPDPTDPAARRWLTPVESPDPSDGKLAHLDGLNLSRAWMLQGIAMALPDGDRGRSSFLGASVAHREAGLGAVTGEHYAGSHWLGSFAVYLETARGLDQA